MAGAQEGGKAPKGLGEWNKLVMEMKTKHNCSLKEALQHAKPIYAKMKKEKAKK
jgi:hypothetical protein